MTHRPEILAGLSAVADRYDALLCDAWGVIHNGRSLFPGAAEALTRFRQERGPVIVITNAPRLSSVIPAQLDRLGLPREAWDAIVTSGDATRAEIEARSDDPIFRLGPDKDQTLFEALPVRFTALQEARHILCTGLMDDETETPEDYRDMLTEAANRALPMICANPDKVVKLGDRMIYCAGALADLYEDLGGTVIQCGKPHPPIYVLCRAALEARRLGARARVLAVGDGLQTDILGANQEGFDVAFVADGIFGDQARDGGGRIDPDRLGTILDDHGVTATYALERLSW